MYHSLFRRRYIMAWQLLLLVFGASWLWAPLLNPRLSYRLSLISDYETPHQPYAWLFRICDALAGLLIMGLAFLLLKQQERTRGWLMMVIGVLFLIDPILPTTCRMTGNICKGSSTLRYLIHGAESVGAGVALFVATVYDSITRKKVVSWSVVILQIIYGVYFLAETVSGTRTQTIYQYIYETSAIVWLAWYGRDFLFDRPFIPSELESNLVKKISAAWAFVNGIVAIVVSLAHIQLVGRLKGLYFAGDNAWLSQHGVIIGVVMLYISRHLMRGERRARQIFLLIVGLETLKYSIIAPDFDLLALYLFTFIFLFIFRDDFDRGVLPVTWTMRFKDLYYMVAGLLLASGIALIALDRDDKASVIASRTFTNFSHYVTKGGLGGSSHFKTILLAHTVSAFLAAAAISIMWILFRPYGLPRRRREDYEQIETLLKRFSDSSEDYFKLWPRDKQYYWSANKTGFIPYKIAGAAVFALADPKVKNKKALAEQFLRWARDRQLKVCFLPVYADSSALYEAMDLQTIQIGASAVINIHTFLAKTVNDKWWRWQKNRAVKKGYSFAVSVPPHPASLMRQFKKISGKWLGSGGHSEYGFALGHFSEDYLNNCIVYYLTGSDGRVIAFTNRVPQFSKSETVTVDLLRYLPEFNNAMPFLLSKTIESINEDGGEYRYFDLGFVPFAKSKGPILSIARTLGGSRFSARGLEQFKNKFDPEWQPNYMAYDGDLGDLATIALRLEQVMKI